MRPIETNEPEHALDQKFRQNLLNHSVEPPAGMWDTLSDSLDAEQKSIRYNHWYYIALFLLIPISALNLYYGDDLNDLGVGKNQVVEADMYENTGANMFSNYVFGTNLPVFQSTNILLNGASNHNKGNHEVIAAHNNTAVYNAIGSQAKGKSAAGAGIPGDVFGYYGKSMTPIVFVGEDYADFGYYDGNRDKRNLDEALFDEISAANSLPYRLLSELTNNDDMMLPESNTVAGRKNKRGGDITIPSYSPLGKMRGFYGGIDVGTNFTRMYLKNDALYPLLGKDVNYYFDPGYFYSISMGYSFSSKLAVEAEWIINSSKGQGFLDNRYGKLFVHGSMTMNYTEIPVMVKYRVTRLSRVTKAPMSFNFVAGLSYSRLKTSRINIGDAVVEDAHEFFAKNELGMLVALEYDMYLTQNLFLNVGVRTGLSTDTKNFKSFGEDIPRIYNLNLGVHAGVYYKLPTRSKSKPMR